MNIRDSKLIQAFATDMRKELCNTVYIQKPLTASELEALIMLFYDVAEMDTGYNCEKEKDVSLFKDTKMSYDQQNMKVYTDYKVILYGSDYEKVKDMLAIIYRFYARVQEDSYDDLDLLKLSMEAFFKKVIHILEKEHYHRNLKCLGDLPDTSAYFSLDPVYRKVMKFGGFPQNIKDNRAALKNKVTVTRNAVHKKEDYGITDIGIKTHELCLAMLIAVYDNYAELQKIIGEYRKTFVWSTRGKIDYLERIIERYEDSDIYDRQSMKERYVEMRVAPENKPVTKVGDNKSEAVLYAPHCIMLHGTAGTGKTTIINHLEYEDALACLDGLKKSPAKYLPIPVKLQFGNLIQGSNVIKNAMCRELKVMDEQLEKLLRNGELHIYLDALDELRTGNDFAKDVNIELAGLINDYPECFIYVTGRKKGNFPSREYCTGRICQLGAMNETEQEALIRAYSPDGDTADTIVGLRENSAYEYLLKIPLFIKMIVRIVSSGLPVPEDEHELRRAYLTDLFEREIDKSKDDSVSVDTMFQLLACIHPNYKQGPSHVPDPGESLAMLPESHVLEQFAYIAGRFCLEGFNSQKMLLKFIDLKVLERKESRYITYSAVEYQDYFKYSQYC